MSMSKAVVAVGAGESRSDPEDVVIFVHLARNAPTLKSKLEAELLGSCRVEVTVIGPSNPL